MADESKRITRLLIEEAYNRGELDVVGELFVPDAVIHDPALQRDVVGVAAVKDMIGAFRRAFPNFVVAVEDQVAEGDRVAIRWTARGTQHGQLLNIPPTGQQGLVSGLTITRFSGGKIVEDRVNWDTLGLLQQLGVITAHA